MPTIKKNQLPHNYEAEKAVLGAMLRSNTVLNEAISKLNVDDFFDENQIHRTIFGVMTKLLKDNVPVDVQTVVNELMNQNVENVTSPSGKVVRFAAKRGELGIYTALADIGYDLNQVKNGVWKDARVGYKKNTLGTI